jgi:hypothetical protein
VAAGVQPEAVIRQVAAAGLEVEHELPVRGELNLEVSGHVTFPQEVTVDRPGMQRHRTEEL